MKNDAMSDNGDGGGVISVSLGAFSLRIDPLGGKVRGVVPADLARNVLSEPHTPYTLEGVRGHSFEVAGWDEACPSVAESIGIPQLGWAWQTHPEMEQQPDCFRTAWHLPGMVVERMLTTEEKRLTSLYRFQNTTSEAMPFLWASHVLYTVEGLLDIEMPGHQIIPGPGCLIEEVESQIVCSGDSARINDFSPIGLSWKFFVPADGPLNLNYSDGTLCVSTTAPWFGVFLNRGRFGPPCLGIEPTTHATDYAENAGQLDPGELKQFSWSLEYRPHA